MADRLLVMSVTVDEASSVQLGQITFDGDRLSGDTTLASETLELLRRRSRLSDPDLFTYLRSNGWSNGAIRVTAGA